MSFYLPFVTKMFCLYINVYIYGMLRAGDTKSLNTIETENLTVVSKLLFNKQRKS